MKKLLFIVFVVSPFFAFAQKLEKPEVDKITGDTTFSTSKNKIGSETALWGADILFVSASKLKAGYMLVFYLAKSGNRSTVYSINKGGRAILKLKGNDLVNLEAVSSEISKTQYSSFNGIITSANSTISGYVLIDENLNKLLSNQIAVIRIETSEGNVDFTIKDKNSDIIKNQLLLLSKGKI
jgi:hypothetical protein